MKKMKFIEKLDVKTIAFFAFIIALIFYLGRRGGIAKGRRQGRVTAQYDEDGIGPNFSADAVALQVYTAFKGFNLFDNGRVDALKVLRSASNAELAKTYNVFNEKFVKAPESMTTFIEGDFLGYSDALKEEIVARLQRLNLT